MKSKKRGGLSAAERDKEARRGESKPESGEGCKRGISPARP